MSKYQMWQKPEFKRPYDIHPVWRVLGCVLIPLLLLVAYAAAEVIVQHGVARGWPLLTLFQIHFPPSVWKIPVLADICRWLLERPHLPAVIVLFFLLAIGLFSLLSTVYAIAYRFVGPPPYTPLDAPPPRRRARPYRR
jgi:hypothetical protein